MIYLASPYSHPDPAVKQQRYEWALQAVAHYISQGIAIYSPIVHNHHIASHMKVPGTWETWKSHDIGMLRIAGQMWVLTLPDWDKSEGIKAEINIAASIGIPVIALEPHAVGISLCHTTP